MPEDTPNSKGPAKVQMSPEQMANLGLTPTPAATAPTEPARVPADQVKPEDIGTLAIEYRDGQPVIVVRGGSVIPAALAVVDASGNPAARFQPLDLSELGGVKPSAFNQYTFSRNDPVNFIDANGN
ncbi:hypothetical protein [Kitasatospora sp. NPDC058046]|uniref:hypothetical protein n=1 Tax=Kitasatospora sp. NPDC058046 TaxID=3346312 RepID=UPI0036DC929D